MNDLWKGIAIAGIWIGIAVVSIFGNAGAIVGVAICGMFASVMIATQ